MPSRRLPKTDDERSAALDACNVKYQATAAPLRLITPAQFAALGGVLSPWRGARGALGPLLAAQTARTATCATCFLVTRRVISQFIQVLNFAIERGTLPASVRAYYELPVNQAEVPEMNTAADLLQWAGKLATGEAQRISAGGAPLAWPAIAEVSAAALALQTNENLQSTAKDAYDAGQEIVAAQRPAVDAWIRDAWDTIEFNLRADEPTSLRRKAREWGVTYEGDEPAEPPPAPPAPPEP